MSDEPVITVATGREDRPIGGVDTVIGPMPAIFYVELTPGEKSLAMQPFGRWLRDVSESSAHSIGEVLHHAEYVITTSASTIQAKGALHDCEHCRAGVRKALRSLRDHPEQELLLGTLYWVQP